MTDPRPVRQVERRRRGCDGGFRSCSGWNGGHSCYLRWGGLHQLDSFGAKLGGQAAVVAVDEAASLGYLFFHYPSPIHCLDIGLGILGGNVLLKLMNSCLDGAIADMAQRLNAAESRESAANLLASIDQPRYPGSVGELTVHARLCSVSHKRIYKLVMEALRAGLNPGDHQPSLRRVDRGLRVGEAHRGPAGPPHPPRPHPGNERRELPPPAQPGERFLASSGRTRRRIGRTANTFSSCSCRASEGPDDYLQQVYSGSYFRLRNLTLSLLAEEDRRS